MRRVVRWAGFAAIVTLLVLGISGRWGDGMLRAYVAAWVALALLGAAIVPEETANARTKRGPPGADPASPWIFRTLGFGHVVVGALDARLEWTAPLPVGLRAAALVVMVAAFAVVLWAAATNRFFVPAVRIQQERGHHLVTGGPYAFMRHPGYAGMLWGVPASALALGSGPALAMAMAMTGFVLRRAALEDRFLQANLPGYADYAGRVRARVLPGVW